MTIAEIHGKVTNTNSEDQLTSDVFTAFKYLPADIGIVGFLRSVPELGDHIPEPTASASCKNHFWPVGNEQGREPDLLLEVSIDDTIYHIVIEAKYRSGPSDIETELVEEEEESGKLGNQLGDELRDLHYGSYRIFSGYRRNRELSLSSKVENRYVLYLTAHPMRPEEDLRRSVEFYPPAADKVCWSSWYHIYDHLEFFQGHFADFPFQDVLIDICTLLDRKRFSPFKGFPSLPEIDLEIIAGRFWDDYRDGIVSFEGVSPPAFSITNQSGRFWI